LVGVGPAAGHELIGTTVKSFGVPGLAFEPGVPIKLTVPTTFIQLVKGGSIEEVRQLT